MVDGTLGDGRKGVFFVGDNETSRPIEGGCRRSQKWVNEPED
jgi:hypothetical protein